MSKYIIAGIDPGATVGIAILDLSGAKIASKSTDGGMPDAVRIVESFGTPSLIACDKVPAPETVQRIASYFSCKLYVPSHNIREEEKRQIAHGAAVANNHERDAYAAAVCGFRLYANKLRQIDALADLQHGEKEKIKHLLLRGYRITDAFASLGESGAEEDTQMGKKPALPSVNAPPTAHVLHREHVLSAGELKERVSSLARENANLRLLIERIDEEKKQLSSRLSLLQNDMRRSLLQDSELRHLKHRLHQSLERMHFKRKNRVNQEKPPVVLQKKAEMPEEDVLNDDAKKIDLEKMVMDYRRRKNKGT